MNTNSSMEVGNYSLDFIENTTMIKCPICGCIFECDFYGSIPKWIFDEVTDEVGTFELIEINNGTYESQCIINDIHMFTANCISRKNYNDFQRFYMMINRIIPFESKLGKIIVRQYQLLKWYNSELDKDIDCNTSFNDNKTYLYLQKALAWDVPLKCYIFYILRKKLCKNLSYCILNYINWYHESDPYLSYKNLKI